MVIFLLAPLNVFVIQFLRYNPLQQFQSRLDMPPYETFEKMNDKLTQAVEETCGFAVE